MWRLSRYTRTSMSEYISATHSWSSNFDWSNLFYFFSNRLSRAIISTRRPVPILARPIPVTLRWPPGWTHPTGIQARLRVQGSLGVDSEPEQPWLRSIWSTRAPMRSLSGSRRHHGDTTFSLTLDHVGPVRREGVDVCAVDKCFPGEYRSSLRCVHGCSACGWPPRAFLVRTVRATSMTRCGGLVSSLETIPHHPPEPRAALIYAACRS